MIAATTTSATRTTRSTSTEFVRAQYPVSIAVHAQKRGFLEFQCGEQTVAIQVQFTELLRGSLLHPFLPIGYLFFAGLSVVVAAGSAAASGSSGRPATQELIQGNGIVPICVQVGQNIRAVFLEFREIDDPVTVRIEVFHGSLTSALLCSCQVCGAQAQQAQT